MDCSYFRARLNQYVDGELGYIEVAELQSHLSFCPHCAAELGQLSELRATLATWGEVELASPPGFAERVATAAALEPKPGEATVGRVVGDVLDALDHTLGRIPLPGGRTIPVKNVLGYGIAATAVLIQVERYLRRTRELKPL
jgi:anti-sigma factor RsiW